MKTKIIISAFLFAVFSILLISQVKLVQARNTTVNAPIIRPITFFTFKIGGNISLRVLNRLIPMPNVTVEAKTNNGNQSYTAQTDISGNYILSVPIGLYKVYPLKFSNFIFSPPLRLVIANKDNLNVSFRGLIQFRR